MPPPSGSLVRKSFSLISLTRTLPLNSTSSILGEMVNFIPCVPLSLSSASRRASVGTCVSTAFGIPLARGVIVSFSFIVPTLPEREHTFVKKLSNGLQRLVRSQVKNLFRKPLVLYVIIRLLNKHLHRHIVVFHQRPPCRQHNSKGNHSASCWCCSWSTLVAAFPPPHVELQRRNHHKSRCEAPSKHPCGEASHSHRPTAASRCRWLQRHTRGCFVPQSQWRWAWHSHGSLAGAPRIRTATPVGEAAEAHHPCSNARRATNPNTATLSPFFILFYSRCRFVCPITDTKNKCTPSQNGRNKKKRRHDPTVPMQLRTLLHPPPLPRRKTQSHRRVSTTMCTTPSCSERWARRGHASPRSILPPLKCCVPTKSGKQNKSAHKPNQHPHSLKHIIRME
ncbi:hypothetical protein TCSYLVIO_008437 [Trypanosoma cruzi]|nr:hypothetical protein TCSYLVIO_008437 [Trypanosoma cruzi]